MKSNVFILLCIAYLLTSCSYHLGTVGGGTGVISNSNFKEVDYAFGTSKTVNVFGIGGNQKDALVIEAKRNLLLNRPLNSGEVLGQTTVDFKRTFIFPVVVNKVTVSSEIIDFSDNQLDSSAFRLNQQHFVGSFQKGEYDFGEMVTYKGQSIARVLGKNKQKYILKFYDGNNNLKVKSVNKKFLSTIEEGGLVAIKPSILRGLETPSEYPKERIKFNYKGRVLEGELIEKNEDTYFILVENDDGKRVGIYVNKKDIVK